MTLGHKISKIMQWSAVGTVLFIGPISAALPIDYASPMGKENWHMVENPLRCSLTITIPYYGVGYFEQYATKTPHFILKKWEPVQRPLSAVVYAHPPVWKPHGQNFAITKTWVRPGAFGLFLAPDPTLKLLGYLSQGYEASFKYHSEQGFNVSVTLSPIRFQKAYSHFQRCLGNLLPFDYSAVKETVFHFDIDAKTIKEADKEQLKRIAVYMDADSEIEFIRIEGFADDSGRKGYNNAISQFRAQNVRDYLLKQGVPKYKIKIIWFGALKPVARNDTEEGRASNRRVVVFLPKK